MTHRAFTSLILIAATMLTVGLVPATATQPEATSLVQIPLRHDADLARVEAAGVAIYARLAGTSGEYLLAGAGTDGVNALKATGLAIRTLDADVAGGLYYLAQSLPGRPTPDWTVYGRLILDDGVQVLLRTTPQDAERLARAGAALRALPLDPKPLRPASTGVAIPRDIHPDPFVQWMLDAVDTSTIVTYTAALSGEIPATIGGEPYTIFTRHTESGIPLEKATQYAYEHLADLGLDVTYHAWNRSGYSGRNVIGELTGETRPEEIFLISAHLDSTSDLALVTAPGADDNASGSVAVLVAADILAQYRWDCTLRFALWTGEEQGLLGSYEYARQAHDRGENIAGVLNLDMIAWESDGMPALDLHANQALPATLDLATLFVDVVQDYDLNLTPEIIPNGSGASDHASFWNYGYTALLGIEDWRDFNIYYHTTYDQLQYLDLPYYTAFIKASVGTFAHMTGCLVHAGRIYLPAIYHGAVAAE
jgi:hypothetical protein